MRGGPFHADLAHLRTLGTVAVRRASAAIAALPLISCLFVAGCTSEMASIEGIAVDTRGGGPGGPDAGIEGKLRLVDGCFYVETSLDTWVVFPRGAVEYVGDDIRFDGVTYEVGDDIIVRGQDVKPDGLEAPATCNLEHVRMAFSTNV